MASFDFEQAIQNYLDGTLNSEDEKQLISWLVADKNKAIFKSYVRTQYGIDSVSSLFKEDTITKNVLAEVKKENSVKIVPLWRRFAPYAAVLLLGIGGYYFFNTIKAPVGTNTVVDSTKKEIKIGSDKATLTLADGEQVVLENGKAFENADVTANGESLVYEAKDETTSISMFNTLTIPRGGQYNITLSDGTKVWLNSATKLKYPVQFISGEVRKVELLYGEAYFDVTSSQQNAGSSFVVVSKGQTVEVLGTEFNVKAYEEETTTYTTLVEGAVALKVNGQNYQLKPSQQAVLNKGANTPKIQVVDTYPEISWKDGMFSFRKKSLEDIMTVLARWYDVEIVYLNPEIKKQGFNGMLGKNQKLETILNTIKDFEIIKDYRIEDKRVYLK